MNFKQLIIAFSIVTGTTQTEAFSYTNFSADKAIGAGVTALFIGVLMKLARDVYGKSQLPATVAADDIHNHREEDMSLQEPTHLVPDVQDSEEAVETADELLQSFSGEITSSPAEMPEILAEAYYYTPSKNDELYEYLTSTC